MNARKQLPVDQWPEADRIAFEAAYRPGDIFDDSRGPGAHLAQGTRKWVEGAYRRWLGFLHNQRSCDLGLPPAERISPDAVGCFIDHLGTEVTASTIAINLGRLLYAARLIAPEQDWSWLRSVVRKLEVCVRPIDRFTRLVPPWQLLDCGLELMESSEALRRPHHCAREIQYRDGLIISLLSIWPIRRRSLQALPVTHHLEIDEDGITIILDTSDTKSKRSEAWRVPDWLDPYVRHYLDDIRPRLGTECSHDGLWGSYRNQPLGADRIYCIVRNRIRCRFGKDMCVHDFRRAAATFIAIEAPDKVGLIPGVLQHTSPEVGQQHYNLSRSTQASRRHVQTITDMRQRLRLRAKSDWE